MCLTKITTCHNKEGWVGAKWNWLDVIKYRVFLTASLTHSGNCGERKDCGTVFHFSTMGVEVNLSAVRSKRLTNGIQIYFRALYCFHEEHVTISLLFTFINLLEWCCTNMFLSAYLQFNLSYWYLPYFWADIQYELNSCNFSFNS